MKSRSAFVVTVALAGSAWAGRHRPGFHTGVAAFAQRDVDAAVVAAKAGKPASYVFDVATDIGDGCTCPPWSLEHRVDVMPVFAPGLPNPHDTYTNAGTYRFFGHFTGRRLTGLDWIAEHHYARATFVSEEDGDHDFRTRQPELAVEDWCFEPRPKLEFDREVVARIAREGRLCSASR